MSSYSREGLESQVSQGGDRGEDDSPRRFDPSLTLELNGKGGFGDSRVWVRKGEGESSSIGLNTGGRKGVGEGERVCGLNELGPLKRLAQVRSVRLVSPTGQTGLAQADRKKIFGLVICRVV